ncbi:hypothetical protein [Lysobacter fragariae]
MNARLLSLLLAAALPLGAAAAPAANVVLECEKLPAEPVDHRP